jgi:hypothetical protein
MTIRDLYATAGGVTGIKAITLRDGTSQCASAVEVTCTGHTLHIGDLVTVDMGWADNHTTVIRDGVVKKIRERRPESDYVIYLFDKLVLANDYFIAADNPDNKLSYTLASPEVIVTDMLSRSGVSYGTLYTDATGFQCGVVGNPLELNCVTAWSVIENLNRITTWMTWTDLNGDIHFQNRKPYIVAGDTSTHTFTTGNLGDITSIDYLRSDDGIRNRIVVYGKAGTGIQAVRSSSSAYLPGGFYKSLVIAHDMIDSQAIADGTADYNLIMFNRLTETVTIEAIGDPNVLCRSIATVTESFTGLSGAQFFVTGTQHQWSQSGYTMTAHLIR